MLISYNRPTDIAWSLIGDGSAWLSDDAGAALTNGRPAAASRLQWLSGAQTTGSILTLRGTWGTAFAPRVIGLVGLTLPVGTLISLAFRRPADDGYTYLADEPQQRVAQLPDGSRCAWFVLDAGLDAVIGVEYRIANDVTGSASIAAGSVIDVGEAWIGPTVDYCLSRTMQDAITDPTVKRRSYGSQPFASQRPAYRTLALDLAPVSDSDMQPLRDIRGASLQGVSLALVPVEDDIYGTACFGVAEPMQLQAMQTGKFWTASMTFNESPATPA